MPMPPWSSSTISYGTERLGIRDTLERGPVVILNREQRPVAMMTYDLSGAHIITSISDDFSFQNGPVQTYAYGQFGSVGTGDVNNDGLDDLVIAPRNPGGKFLIYVQDEAGRLNRLPEGDAPARAADGPMVFGDFNNDGLIDIGLRNRSDIFVHFAIGPGEFGPDNFVGRGNLNPTLAAGQLDGIGGDEIIFATSQESLVYSYLPDQDSWQETGRFTARSQFFHAVIDINNDGVNEILVAGSLGASSDRRTFAQTVQYANGQWIVNTGLEVPYGGGGTFLIGDLDGDGHLDVVCTGDEAVIIFYGSNSGSELEKVLAYPARFANHGTPRMMLQLEPDSAKHLVFSSGWSTISGQLLTFLCPDENGYGPELTFELMPSLDQIINIVEYPNPIGGRRLLFYKDVSSPNLRRLFLEYTPSGLQTEFRVDPSIQGRHLEWFAFPNFSGLGTSDFVGVRRPPTGEFLFIDVRYSDGNGNFLPLITRPSAFAQAGPVSVGDFNGDGRQDIALANADGPGIEVFLGTLLSGPTVRVELPTFFKAGILAAGDFDADGYSDIAAISRYGETEIFYGDPSGQFVTRVRTWLQVPGITDWVERNFDVADFNGDSRDDICLISGDDILIVYALPGKAIDVVPQRIIGRNNIRGVRAVDLNSDGRPEITAYTLSQMLIFQQDVAGNYTRATDAWEHQVLTSQILDLDGDGQSDFVGTTATDSRLRVMYGRSGRHCIADFDRNGLLNWMDIGAFLAEFNEGSRFADLTADGRLDFHDLARFVQAFSAGCR